jgi:hypothetical protein
MVDAYVFKNVTYMLSYVYVLVARLCLICGWIAIF